MSQQEKEKLSTSDDQSKDMEFEGSEYKNQEGESQSTAAEGELKKVDENEQQPETKNDTPTKTGDPTHIPTLEEDESLDKEQG